MTVDLKNAHWNQLFIKVKPVDAKTVIPVHAFEPGERAKRFPNVTPRPWSNNGSTR
jgi:hypothetical protein